MTEVGPIRAETGWMPGSGGMDLDRFSSEPPLLTSRDVGGVRELSVDLRPREPITRIWRLSNKGEDWTHQVRQGHRGQWGAERALRGRKGYRDESKKAGRQQVSDLLQGEAGGRGYWVCPG